MAHTYKQLPPNVPALFKNLADKTFAAVMPEINTATGGSMVGSFIPGTLLHIVARLEEMSSDPGVKDNRFPLIGFVHDFKTTYLKNNAIPEITVRIFIANLTAQDRRTEDRMTVNFIPILYPLLAEFISQIKASNYFMKDYGSEIEMEIFDRMHWGKEGIYGPEKYEINEFIDGIEIQNMRLRLNIPNCISAGLSVGQIKTIF